jgi:hypothetical protein
MSIATIHTSPSTTTRTRRTRAARKPAKLIVEIDGVLFQIKPFDIGDQWGDGRSKNGFEHALRGPDGPWFWVWDCDGEMGEHSGHCELCGVDGCEHVRALVDVGMMGV